MQELFVNKIHFFKFLSVNDKPQLVQLKIINAIRSTLQASLNLSIHARKGKYQQRRGNTVCKKDAKSQQLFKHSKISYSIASLVLRKFSCGIHRNDLNRDTSKPPKVRAMLVLYLLSGIHILVY